MFVIFEFAVEGFCWTRGSKPATPGPTFEVRYSGALAWHTRLTGCRGDPLAPVAASAMFPPKVFTPPALLKRGASVMQLELRLDRADRLCRYFETVLSAPSATAHPLVGELLGLPAAHEIAVFDGATR